MSENGKKQDKTGTKKSFGKPGKSKTEKKPLGKPGKNGRTGERTPFTKGSNNHRSTSSAASQDSSHVNKQSTGLFASRGSLLGGAD